MEAVLAAVVHAGHPVWVDGEHEAAAAGDSNHGTGLGHQLVRWNSSLVRIYSLVGMTLICKAHCCSYPDFGVMKIGHIYKKNSLR